MKTYFEQGEYRCVLLEPQDWETLRDLRLRQLEEEQEQELLEQEREYSKEEWRQILGFDEEKTFCLYKNQEPLGFASILIDKSKNIGTLYSHIFEQYRGQHLIDPLRNTQIRFLVAETNAQFVQVEVERNNVHSKSVAKRHGFKKTGECIETQGRIFDIYRKSLDDPRAKHKPGEPAPEA